VFAPPPEIKWRQKPWKILLWSYAVYTAHSKGTRWEIEVLQATEHAPAKTGESPFFKTARVAKSIWRLNNTIASVWRENMIGWTLCGSRKTVRFSEQIMLADKYPSTSPCQVEAIVYVFHPTSPTCTAFESKPKRRTPRARKYLADTGRELVTCVGHLCLWNSFEQKSNTNITGQSTRSGKYTTMNELFSWYVFS